MKTFWTIAFTVIQIAVALIAVIGGYIWATRLAILFGIMCLLACVITPIALLGVISYTKKGGRAPKKHQRWITRITDIICIPIYVCGGFWFAGLTYLMSALLTEVFWAAIDAAVDDIEKQGVSS